MCTHIGLTHPPSFQMKVFAELRLDGVCMNAIVLSEGLVQILFQFAFLTAPEWSRVRLMY